MNDCNRYNPSCNKDIYIYIYIYIYIWVFILKNKVANWGVNGKANSMVMDHHGTPQRWLHSSDM
jgi:hypothetical protein